MSDGTCMIHWEQRKKVMMEGKRTTYATPYTGSGELLPYVLATMPQVNGGQIADLGNNMCSITVFEPKKKKGKTDDPTAL
tara:strand:- start:129 stop:368 length:240 start_codon:yes stop_codon:yes gene_type:complete